MEPNIPESIAPQRSTAHPEYLRSTAIHISSGRQGRSHPQLTRQSAILVNIVRRTASDLCTSCYFSEAGSKVHNYGCLLIKNPRKENLFVPCPLLQIYTEVGHNMCHNEDVGGLCNLSRTNWEV